MACAACIIYLILVIQFLGCGLYNRSPLRIYTAYGQKKIASIIIIFYFSWVLNTMEKIEKYCKPRIERYMKDAPHLKQLHTKHFDIRNNRREVFRSDIEINLVTNGDDTNEANERLKCVRF